MITIYHNPRCTKSREGLHNIEKSKEHFQVRNYYTNLFTETELIDVLHKLDIKPIELVRTKEKIWIDNFKNKAVTDAEIIAALLIYPQLIERPIIVFGKKAVIARPLEKIKKLNL